MKTQFLAALLFLCLVPNAYADVVPCVKKLNGRWRIDRQEKCLQYTQTEGVAIASNKRLVRSLRLEVGNLKLQMLKKDAALKEWKDVRLVSWQTQLKFLAGRLGDTEKQVVLWRTTALDLKKMKPPTVAQWYKHPALWTFIGFAAGMGVTLATAAVLKETNIVTTSKPLLAF